MKAVFYSHTGKVSGAEVVLLLLLNEIDRQRFEPVFICPSAGGLAQRVKEIGIEQRPVRELKARFTWNPLSIIRYMRSLAGAVRELRDEIREIAPDVVHANSVRAGITATFAARGKRIPVFWHIQDELKLHPFSTCIRIVALLSRNARLIPASKATEESFRGILLKVFGRRIPTKVVYNAIDLQRFSRDERKRAEHRRNLPISKDEFVFGVVGQITPRKGQLELVKAFSELSSPSTTLLIVGEPLFNSDHEYLSAIRNEIASHGLDERVLILGARNDVPDIMRSLDTLVVNSRSEAFVVVGIEAMASGTPVIATDVGGIREMISHGESGLLIPFGDRQRLVDAMRQIMNDADLRRSCSANGARFVTERLNSKTFVREMENFFVSESAEERRKGFVFRTRSAKSNV